LTEEKHRIYTGDQLLQVAMPLGGIGAGCICLNGYGGLQDFSIRHSPHLTAIPDRNLHSDAAFALLRFPGLGVTRLVEGPLPVGKIYDQGLKGQGHWGGGHEGFPRFRNCEFVGEYPFGSAHLSDPGLPVEVRITGFNPFVPLDVKNSAIPCAILEYQLENISGERLDYEFSYHLSHLAPGANPLEAAASRNAPIPGRGIFFDNREDPYSAGYGSASLSVIGHEPRIKAMWFRGGWFDALSVLWREISGGDFQPNDGRNPGGLTGRNGGSILLAGSLAPGEKITYPILIAWHFPNVHFSVGGIVEEQGCGEGCTCGKDPGGPAWRPYYAAHWEDARQAADYVAEHYLSLRTRTQAFHDALFSSTLPTYVLEAVSANLAILKSPTVLLQENGNLWGWEGCFAERGCCPGSCTHVWNYAQSIPHLFPQLERSLREQELQRSMDERGHVTFRAALPDGPPAGHAFHAAADGQLGGILKVYREWQISGDGEWLLNLYPRVKRSIDYCIETWDPRHQGILEEPHHNTYDIEFWGADGMCSSIYVSALTAMALLGEACGFAEDSRCYAELSRRGAGYLDEHLFNGEYYQQEVRYRGLRDSSFAEKVEQTGEDAPQEERLLREEGPKYQYGPGCLSDGIIGAWLAEMCGVCPPLSPEHIRQSLSSIYKYNFKQSLWEHANPQRPGYAVGDEPGLLLCTWPRGGRPALPFVYSDEVWTGIEYQAASHMIACGLVEEGLAVVKAARSRYDGRVRNPWNEYECGSYYARAMASYALLAALSGLRYSAVSKSLTFAPRLEAQGFKTFFSTASGWGTIALSEDELVIELVEGELQIDSLHIQLDGEVRTFQPHITVRAGAPGALQL